ncbi:MAG: putative Ig domain-containing protein [Candidatus Zixiibacteriota bacterium]|nr:MAG: putative Ig domain-containing protein [candidate division Zixibacteria bacterium]
MRIKLIVVMFIILALAANTFAQKIVSREDFRNSEWRMKSEYYKKLLERNGGSVALDQSDYDVKYWELDVDVTNIIGQIIYGKVTMTSESMVNGLTTVDYDFHSNMTVDSAFMGGNTVSYTRPNHLIRVTLDRAYDEGEQFTTVIYYHGHPPGGNWGSFTWGQHNGQPIISTLSEPEGAREWWPCKDMPHDKSDSSDVYITVPDNLVATSNGRLVSNNNNGNGTRTFHWQNSYPITTYLISLAISNYQSFTDWYVNTGGDSMPIVNYVYPEHYNQAVEDLNIIPQAIGIFADMFGEYPFINEKYGHSIFAWGGAMEHQCNTSYGSMLITGGHDYDWIAVHELAHMWFGDLITCDTWPNIWTNEGFASYLEALWTEELLGHAAYLNYMRISNGVLYPSGPIYDPWPLFDGNTVYNKGSWILHMLRGVMGDETFFDAMYGYANHPDHMYGTITTQQFQAIMEQYYGASLTWYFQQWLWGVNRPTYQYSWMAENIGGGQYELFLHIDQVQVPPTPTVFTMPIKIYPRIGGVDTLVTVWNDSREDDFRIVLDGNPTMVRFDIDDWVLKFASQTSYTMNIVTTELPDGDPGEPYSEVIEARGGNGQYTFTLYNGSLPDGLTLDENTGVISGTPVAEGVYDFTIRCTDTTPYTDDQEYTVIIGVIVDTEEDEPPQPWQFALIGNYPNPFNNSTILKFRLAEELPVRLDIYNLQGQKVESLVDGVLGAGAHEVIWKAGSVASGVYFYRLDVGSSSSVKKMTLIK